MKRVAFSEKQPEYRYFPLADGNADVFVYSFIGEDTVGMGEEITETKVFLYDVNEFRVAQNVVSEDMVKANPENYLDYTPHKAPTQLDIIEAQTMYTALMTDTLLEEGTDNV